MTRRNAGHGQGGEDLCAGCAPGLDSVILYRRFDVVKYMFGEIWSRRCGSAVLPRSYREYPAYIALDGAFERRSMGFA